ncbi:MAG: hypothetical protein RBT25_10460, partial [Lentisphaeria bacterium]|nr:hypothetical protein [Lentisphaeria bacterium]
SIAANRLLSGWLFWQSAVPAHVSWTYSWSRNEFETGKPSWCMAYPRNNKAERIMDSSLQLEGLREGIIDYKMIALLHKLIEEAKMQKKEKPAESAEALLQNLLSEQIKWRQDFRLARELNAQRSIDNAALEAMRWVLATEIMKLRELLK